MRKAISLCYSVFFAAATLFMPSSAAAEIQLLDAVKDEPLELTFRADQEITDAVTQFRTTGKNPYSADKDAIAGGQKLYKRNCQACHKKDGSGAVGPNLRDDEWEKARTNTHIGRFEIIYGGGKKGMQAFGKKLDQDDILKVMAFIDTFRTEKKVAKKAPKLPPKPAKKKKKVKSKPPVPFTEAYLAAADNIVAPPLPRCQGVSWQSPKAQTRQIQTGFRLSPRDRRFPQNAWLERTV